MCTGTLRFANGQQLSSKITTIAIPINPYQSVPMSHDLPFVAAPAEQRYRLSLLQWLWLWRSPDKLVFQGPRYRFDICKMKQVNCVWTGQNVWLLLEKPRKTWQGTFIYLHQIYSSFLMFAWFTPPLRNRARKFIWWILSLKCSMDSKGNVRVVICYHNFVNVLQNYPSRTLYHSSKSVWHKKTTLVSHFKHRDKIILVGGFNPFEKC